ncbi:MAG: hypothetical protein OHK0013_15550 [Sandaracinaceae bacterium]
MITTPTTPRDDTAPADLPPRVVSLAVYYFDGCPYCERVRRSAKALGLELAWRDIDRDRSHRRDLLAARGRGTVPVLRIHRERGRDIWMPESADIVSFLEEHAAGRTPALPEPPPERPPLPRAGLFFGALGVMAALWWIAQYLVAP